MPEALASRYTQKSRRHFLIPAVCSGAGGMLEVLDNVVGLVVTPASCANEVFTGADAPPALASPTVSWVPCVEGADLSVPAFTEGGTFAARAGKRWSICVCISTIMVANVACMAAITFVVGLTGRNGVEVLTGEDPATAAVDAAAADVRAGDEARELLAELSDDAAADDAREVAADPGVPLDASSRVGDARGAGAMPAVLPVCAAGVGVRPVAAARARRAARRAALSWGDPTSLALTLAMAATPA